jgi:hypothetical protein
MSQTNHIWGDHSKKCFWGDHYHYYKLYYNKEHEHSKKTLTKNIEQQYFYCIIHN